jgi:putative ABC transport system permease protein
MRRLVLLLSLPVRAYRRRRGGFALAAIALSLGIGSATALYRVATALLRPGVPVVRPDRVVTVLYGNPKGLYRSHAYADFEYYRSHADTLSSVAAFESSDAIVETGDRVATVLCEYVSPEYFPLLGVSPEWGFPLVEAGAQTSSDIPAVVSHAFWVRRLGSAREVSGRQIRVNRRFVTIVGVIPADFAGLYVDDKPEIWLPIRAAADIQELSPAQRAALFGGRTNESFDVIGRLRDGVTVRDAESQIRTLHAALDAAEPRGWGGADGGIRVVPIEDAQLLPPLRGPVVDVLRLTLVATLLVLLAGYINAAGFLLLTFRDREHETATRLALGAQRSAVGGEFLAEAVGFTLLATAAGVLLSEWALRSFGDIAQLLSSAAHPDFGLHLDVLMFAAVTAVIVGHLIGVVPVAMTARLNILAAMKRSTAAAARRRWRLSTADVCLSAQVALSVLLLMVGVSVVKSLRALPANPGFANRDVQVFTVVTTPIATPAAAEDAKRSFREVLEQVVQLPEVASAALAWSLPLDQRKTMRQIRVGRVAESVAMDCSAVSAGYFETLGIRLIQGRSIAESDSSGALDVAVVNESFARRYWPGETAIGRTFDLIGRGTPAKALTVVGVAETGRYRDLSEHDRPFCYLALAQHQPYPLMQLIARPRGTPGQMVQAIVRAIQAGSTTPQISRTTEMAALIRSKTVRQRVASQLTVVGSVVSLALAVIGIYSTTAYSVKRRQREIGIRIAIGASSGRIIRLIAANGILTLGIGVVFGYALSFVVVRSVQDVLFGAGQNGITASLIAGVVMTASGMLAAVMAARGAAGIEPALACRAE